MKDAQKKPRSTLADRGLAIRKAGMTRAFRRMTKGRQVIASPLVAKTVGLQLPNRHASAGTRHRPRMEGSASQLFPVKCIGNRTWVKNGR